MATEVIQGSKEYLIGDVVDKSLQLHDLAGTNPKFSVEAAVGGVMWYTNATAIPDGMTLFCLIDTSAAHALGLWPAGEYKLTATFDTPAEKPVVYLGSFTVRDP